MKKVGVVILNFKLKDLTLSCIRSVKKSSYKSIKLIVVDNNSNDGIEKGIDQNIIFIQAGENLGYSGGNNVGIKKALEIGSDYIFILNPDTEIEEKTIEVLVGKMEKENTDIGGPKIFFSSSNIIWYAGGIFDSANVIGKHRGVDEKDQGQYKGGETDFVSGAAMMVKKEVFEKVGFFDEDYFLYYEDSDFCLRAKKKGFKVMYIPEAVIYHANAKSTTLGSPLQDYYITRNRMLYAKKHLSLRTQFALFREALKNISRPARRKALIDFIFCNLGKGSN